MPRAAENWGTTMNKRHDDEQQPATGTPNTRPPVPDPLTQELAQLGQNAARPGGDLLARVLADAEAVQAGYRRAEHRPTRPTPTAAAEPDTAPLRWWRMPLGLLGGAQGLAGLASAAVAGFWIGAYPPASVADIGASFWGVSIIVEIDDDLFFDLED